MFKHILTATDGSDWAFKGVKVAIDMAATHGAKLTVLTVTEPYPEYAYAEGMIPMPDSEQIRAANQIRAREVLDDIYAQAVARGIETFTVHIPDAHAATEIVAQADGLGADLIVIGSRGRRGLTKLILGSQAAEVLAGTHLPVLIVK